MFIHSSPATWPPKAISPPLLIDPLKAASNVPPPGDGSPGLTTLEIVPCLSARKRPTPNPMESGGPASVAMMPEKTMSARLLMAVLGNTPAKCPPPGTGVPGRATALSVCVPCEKRKRPELNTGPVKGSKEKGIAMSPPAFMPRRPSSVGPKTPPPGAGWPERIICASSPRSPTNTPSPPVVTSAVKPTSPRLLMALGSKSKVKLPPPGAGLSRNAIGVKLYPASPAKATGTSASASAAMAAIFFIVIFFVFIFC